MSAPSDKHLAVAVRAARAGGSILLRSVGKLKRSDLTMKGESDWVTTIDKASERAILRILRRAFPTHAIRAEESGATGEKGLYQWYIDPLDGTTNFIHSFPMFCVSIGMAYRGRLELAVIYDPQKQELFTARRGKGAFLNGRRIRVSAHQGMRDAMLCTGFPFRAKANLDPYLESFRALFMKTGSIRRAGSAALDLAYVACGRAEGFWELALSPWDMAAGALLVTEAGGKVSDFFGKQTYLSSGHIAAANRSVHGGILEVTRKVFRRGVK